MYVSGWCKLNNWDSKLLEDGTIVYHARLEWLVTPKYPMFPDNHDMLVTTIYSINISCLEYKLHPKLLCGDLAWQLNPALCSFGQAAYSIVEVLQHPSWFDTVLILLLQLCILKLTGCFFRLALAYYLSVFTQVWIEGQHHANLEG